MTDLTNLAAWVHDNAIAGSSLDPWAPLDDLEPLRAVIGDARVVAVGESAHHVREFYLLRHRLLRFLAERCGFTVYAFETPFTEALAIDAWIQDGPGTVTAAAAADNGAGLTGCPEMHDHLAWMRDYNRTAAQPLRFAGTIPLSDGTPLSALAVVRDYLRWADPDALPLLDRAAELATRYLATNFGQAFAGYTALEQGVRDALTATLSRLLFRMETMTAYQRGRRRGQEHATALQHLRGAWHLDHFCRDFAGQGLAVGTTALDAFAAESVLRRLEHGTPETRIVLALHNVHLRRTMVGGDGPVGLFPAGYHLAQALGDKYVAIAVTSGGGRAARGQLDPDSPTGFDFRDHPLPPPADGSIETAFKGEAPVAVADLRAARPEVDDADSFQRIRMENYFADVPVFDGFDAIAHIPHTSSTENVAAAGVDAQG